MSTAIIKARLNLYAVLQNLEELVRLDGVSAALIKDWDTVIQFSVKNGPAAYLEFKNGVCRHGVGTHISPTFKLFFFSCNHLNQMFDGDGKPIPLKGLFKIGFLTKQFPKLIDRLKYFLNPEAVENPDDEYMKICATLSLYTGLYAVPELACYDATCQKLAAATPLGTLSVEIQPDGPSVQLTHTAGGFTPGKTKAEKPLARMTFCDWKTAYGVLTGSLDGAEAISRCDMLLQGQLPLVESAILLMDRVEKYLKIRECDRWIYAPNAAVVGEASE